MLVHRRYPAVPGARKIRHVVNGGSIDHQFGRIAPQGEHNYEAIDVGVLRQGSADLVYDSSNGAHLARLRNLSTYGKWKNQ